MIVNIEKVLDNIPFRISSTIHNLKDNYMNGCPQATKSEIEHNIVGYLIGIYDCDVITSQEREALYNYCIGKPIQ